VSVISENIVISIVNFPEPSHDPLAYHIERQGEKKQDQSQGKKAVVIDRIVAKIPTADSHDIFQDN
jgi:hypothetical protein